MKQTIWIEIDFNECSVIAHDFYSTGYLRAIKISHPALKKPRWFTESLKGNYYSRYTGHHNDPYAEGYILTNFNNLK